MMRVLVVEDEIETAAAHAKYVQRCEGFTVAGVAHTAAEATQLVRDAAEHDERIDLLLLDLNLPDRHGLELARELRSDGLVVDVMALTAVRELDIVRAAVSVGVMQYLIKPFVFSDFNDRMRRYLQYRTSLDTSGHLTQQEVDRAIRALRTSNDSGLAKGLSRETLDSVSTLVRSNSTAWSAAEVGAVLGLTRVTARRYLEYLTGLGVLVRAPRHGTRGRPEIRYELSK